MTRKTVVKVTIVGEEYTLRSDATPEHTRAVAEYVDRAIRAVMNGSGLVSERHKAAILAALRALSADIRDWLPAAGSDP